MHNIFITGIAGFIGFHLAEKLTFPGRPGSKRVITFELEEVTQSI